MVDVLLSNTQSNLDHLKTIFIGMTMPPIIQTILLTPVAIPI